LATEAEQEQSVAVLTSGAMAEVWEWTRAQIPEGVEIFDAHAHIGVDLDGREMTAGGMRARMEAAGVGRSIVFALNDPNAREDFSDPNDVVWAAYEEHPEFFVPFFRLNPHNPFEREFDRCAQRGFRGLKLHPVSQEFELDDPPVLEIFERAAGLDLPVLVHAGFAMERIVEPLTKAFERAPGLRLILGHAAMVELVLAAREFGGMPNVLFDTSVVSAHDLYVLFCQLSPRKVCYGSDIPYGDIPSTLFSALGAARAAGLDDEEVSGVLSGNIRRWFG
jgi:uncharacterized protein